MNFIFVLSGKVPEHTHAHRHHSVILSYHEYLLAVSLHTMNGIDQQTHYARHGD